ncbi:Hypothetical predicted protein [Lynx pardinus]|uniref:Uncharacterized protein n=1 Tax=Lynx pardinus TaxID=191816 RepID=A0A485NU43_LYNPA|nr:Hypothetical predicted protein [Lynx pardinus]
MDVGTGSRDAAQETPGGKGTLNNFFPYFQESLPDIRVTFKGIVIFLFLAQLGQCLSSNRSGPGTKRGCPCQLLPQPWEPRRATLGVPEIPSLSPSSSNLALEPAFAPGHSVNVGQTTSPHGFF